jgi:integrase
MHSLVERYALEHDIRPNSLEQLQYAVQGFAAFLGHTPAKDDFSDDTVNRYLTWLPSQGLAPPTIHGRRRGLLTLWRSMVIHGWPEPRRIKRLAPLKMLPRAWTGEQIGAILAQCDQLDGTFKNHPRISRRLFARAFVLTAYETGFRRSDLLRIRRPQITPEGTIVLVQSKTGLPHVAKVRPPTVQAIDAMGCQGRELVFGGLISVRRLSRLFDGLFRAAGMPEGSLKWLRRSGATHVEMVYPGTGWRFLGHTSPRIAQKSYLDPLQVGQQALIPPEPPKAKRRK